MQTSLQTTTVVSALTSSNSVE